MPEPDGGFDNAEVYAVDQREQARVSAQLVVELVERAQGLLALCHERGVVLKGEETGGIVNMPDGYSCGLELLAKEHVLVAIRAELAVEGVGNHDVAPHQEIGSVEMLVGPLAALLGSMFVFMCFLVEETKA